MFGGDPAAVLDEEDPVRALVYEAIAKKVNDLDHERDKRLAREIGNEVAQVMKRMFG